MQWFVVHALVYGSIIGGNVNSWTIFVDIDECSRVHGCEHECINSPGSFTCSCKSGWVLSDDGTSCQVDGEFISTVCRSSVGLELSGMTLMYCIVNNICTGALVHLSRCLQCSILIYFMIKLVIDNIY